jgi:hypothetical protein
MKKILYVLCLGLLSIGCSSPRLVSETKWKEMHTAYVKLPNTINSNPSFINKKGLTITPSKIFVEGDSKIYELYINKLKKKNLHLTISAKEFNDISFEIERRTRSGMVFVTVLTGYFSLGIATIVDLTTANIYKISNVPHQFYPRYSDKFLVENTETNNGIDRDGNLNTNAIDSSKYVTIDMKDFAKVSSIIAKPTLSLKYNQIVSKMVDEKQKNNFSLKLTVPKKVHMNDTIVLSLHINSESGTVKYHKYYKLSNFEENPRYRAPSGHHGDTKSKDAIRNARLDGNINAVEESMLYQNVNTGNYDPGTKHEPSYITTFTKINNIDSWEKYRQNNDIVKFFKAFEILDLKRRNFKVPMFFGTSKNYSDAEKINLYDVTPSGTFLLFFYYDRYAWMSYNWLKNNFTKNFRNP